MYTGILNSIRKRIFYKFLPLYIKYLNEREKQKDSKIPKYELQDVHLENTVILCNRIDLLKRIPKGGVIAEVGVNKGEFSEKILCEVNPSKLHLIDIWSSNRYPGKLEFEVRDKFLSEIENGIIEINKGLSVDILETFPENYFDFIYIDTDHSYSNTIKELKISSKKVKEDGIIGGHDFNIGQWNNRIRYGVIEAVHQFCVQCNWEILYLTHEAHRHLSFALRKIRD